ncbi:MAG: ACP S-malonyltransferase [Acidobacteria bacterium]|nr:ACP S-malonyltransferase [Acidobacteriota bacterium]
MNSTAFIFPGQGSQTVGMGKGLAERFPEASETFAQADEILGLSLSRLCFEGPAGELNLTANTQPALLTCSVATLRVLQASGVRPALVAGHSLGEYSALVAAQALDFADALRITRKRGEWMQEAAPVGAGSMAAILGLPESEVAAICASVRNFIVAPANFNSPGQTVIAGHRQGVEQASQIALERGALKAIPLQVSAPFHCPLMEPAEKRLAELLRQVPFRDLGTPLVCNVDARAVKSGEEARDCLIRQVSRPVKWLQSIELMVELGISEFVEVGPGKILSGLVRRIARRAKTASVEDVASLESLLAARSAGG